MIEFKETSWKNTDGRVIPVTFIAPLQYSKLCKIFDYNHHDSKKVLLFFF